MTVQYSDSTVHAACTKQHAAWKEKKSIHGQRMPPVIEDGCQEHLCSVDFAGDEVVKGGHLGVQLLVRGV